MSALDLAAARAASQAFVDEFHAGLAEMASPLADLLRDAADFVQAYARDFAADPWVSVTAMADEIDVHFQGTGGRWPVALWTLHALTDATAVVARVGETVHLRIRGSYRTRPVRVATVADEHGAVPFLDAVEWTDRRETPVTAELLWKLAAAVTS